MRYRAAVYFATSLGSNNTLFYELEKVSLRVFAVYIWEHRVGAGLQGSPQGLCSGGEITVKCIAPNPRRTRWSTVKRLLDLES